MSTPNRGRRPGSPDTRAAILEAARALFAERGYAGTSMRAIGAAAGVDPALVHHYFGRKDDLFMASLQVPFDPREALRDVVSAGPADAGEGLVRTFLSVWDDPELQPRLVAFVRSVLEPSGQRLLTEGFLPAVVLPVARALGIDHPERRMPLVASQVLGLILMRYVLRMEPLASMPADQVVATYAPTIQRYLTGELP